MAPGSTTTKPAIPLTTIFTPPASCLGTITYDGTTAWQNGVRQTGDPNCYPASFADILYSWYSPGICPSQWTAAQTIAGSGSALATVAYCCPSNYSLYTTSARILLANYCYSSLGSPVTNVASVPSLTTGPLPTNAPLITLQPSKAANAIVYADVIQIHWRSNNTDVVQLMSGVAASGSAVSATPGTSPTTTPYSTTNLVTYSPTTSPSSSTLSSGARAGVGVGVALGVIALLALIAFVLFQGKRRKASQPHPAAAAYQGDIPGVQEHSDKKPAEIDAPVDIKAAEMDAPVGTKLAEMDTHVDATRPAEMEAREIKELRGSKVAADVEST